MCPPGAAAAAAACYIIFVQIRKRNGLMKIYGGFFMSESPVRKCHQSITGELIRSEYRQSHRMHTILCINRKKNVREKANDR